MSEIENIYNDEDSNNFEFLNNLHNDTFIEKIVLTPKQQQKQEKDEEKSRIKEEKRQIRENKLEETRQKKCEKELNTKMKQYEKSEKNEKNEIYEKDTKSDQFSLFDENPTVLIGRDRLFITKQINQYKVLFPNELSKFKVKRNATLDELNQALEECRALIEINSVDNFIMDSILGSIKMIEGFTVDTSYDITSLSIMLKMNPEFQKLAKLLFIRYNIFNNVPIEYQMMMIVTTSIYLCIQKNNHKSSMNSYLHENI